MPILFIAIAIAAPRLAASIVLAACAVATVDAIATRAAQREIGNAKWANIFRNLERRGAARGETPSPA